MKEFKEDRNRFLLSDVNTIKIIKNPSQNSSYLDEVSSFIKLNYKCKREDSPDGSNKCSDNKNQINNNGSKQEFSYLEKFTKDPRLKYKNEEDMVLKEMVKKVGFDKLPIKKSETEINQLVESGHIELFRGVTTSSAIDKFKSGEYFAGQGNYGNGIYVARGDKQGAEIAFNYSRGTGNIIRMVLTKDAKIASFSDAMNASKEFMEESRKTEDPNKRDVLQLFDEFSKAALAKGYDAVDVGGGNMVVLNRGKLIVQDNTPDKGYIKNRITNDR